MVNLRPSSANNGQFALISGRFVAETGPKSGRFAKQMGRYRCLEAAAGNPIAPSADFCIGSPPGGDFQASRGPTVGDAITLLVLLQFLKSNADMAALAVAAVASPTAGDDIDSQKTRPSMENLMSSLWVAGLVMSYVLRRYVDESRDDMENHGSLQNFKAYLPLFLLWALGVARMVLRFVAFQHANGSFAIGRNARLIEGYMGQLQEQEDHLVPVPRLIVTG